MAVPAEELVARGDTQELGRLIKSGLLGVEKRSGEQQ